MSSVPAPPSEAPLPSSPPPRWTELWARRVPQILGLYVGGATSAVLFVEFLVGRYALSPYLVDALLLALVLALPAVAVLTYAHGAPGAQRWTRKQAAVLGTNALLGTAVLLAAFWGKPLGATTETVTVETADGETVERTVAKAAFRKRVVVSDFTGDDALGRAVGYALANDLRQDLFVAAYGAGSLRRSSREAGFETLAAAPIALVRDAARELLVDRLVTGSVERTARGFRVEADLRPLSGGSRPDHYALEGPDLLRLVDDLSSRIRADLGLPEGHLVETEDVAVEDLLTGSVEALVAWADGHHASNFLDDRETSLRRYEEAVALDSTFAMAHVARGGRLLQFSRQTEAQEAFAAAQRHRYRLSEADRFSLDATVARYEQRPGEALAIVREWAALYPDDIEAQERLASLLYSADDADAATAVYRRLIDLDPSNPVRRYSLASLLVREARFEAAREEIEAYIAGTPDDPDGHALLAHILMSTGDLDGALEAGRQAVRLDPTDTRYPLYLAGTLTRSGAWDEAEAAYRRTVAQATEPSDRAAAINGLVHLYDAQGRYAEAAGQLDELWGVMAEYTTPTQIVLSRLGEGYHYVRAGRTDTFERTLAEALSRPEIAGSEAYRGSTAMMAAYAYANTDQPDKVFAYTATADSLLRSFGQDSALPWVRAIRGLAHAGRGDWDRAVRALAPYVAESPTDYYRAVALAEAYAAAGNRDQAREVAERVLVSFPAQPGAHLVLAKLSRQRPAEARRHLDAALAGWAQADAGFGPAREARALRQRLAG